MVICLGRGADLHMALLMQLPLTVSCFSKIQIGFTFVVLAYPGNSGQNPDSCKAVLCSLIAADVWNECVVTVSETQSEILDFSVTET